MAGKMRRRDGQSLDMVHARGMVVEIAGTDACGKICMDIRVVLRGDVGR
jgi:hypothetical protein